MNKWIGCAIVLNEEKYISAALDGIADFMNDIVIIHGSTRHTPADAINSEGLSVDKTVQAIMDHPAQKKIHLSNVGKVPSKTELRNLYLNTDIIKDGDWIFVFDGDEVYDLADLSYLWKLMRDYPLVEYIQNQELRFWGDYEHTLDVDEIAWLRSKEQFYFYDCFGHALINGGRYHERIFKFHDGYHYVSHEVISDSQNRKVHEHPAYADKRILVDWAAPWYHYGYLKPRKNLEWKLQYYRHRGDRSRINELTKYLAGESVETEILKVNKFDGIHPEPIRKMIAEGRA